MDDKKIRQGPKSTLQFEGAEPAATSGQIGPKLGKSKKPHAKFREYSEQSRPSERLGAGDTPPVGGADRESRSFDKSALRAEKTGAKLQHAIGKQKPFKKPGVIKGVGRTLKTQLWLYTHGKIYQAEHENTGIEAAHRVELAGEAAGRGTSRFIKKTVRTRPARQVRTWEKRNIKAKADLQFRKMSREHPELKKNGLSRFMQKQRLKRRYQRQARAAAKRSARAARRTTRIAVRIFRAVAMNPKALFIIGIALVLVVLFHSCVSLFASFGGGMGGVVGAISYLAEDADIDKAELMYTEWETDLRVEIANMETTYPGYDGYRYNIGSIGHDPFELMAFLTAVYGKFTYDEIEGVLWELFDEQYSLTTRVITETQTETVAAAAGESIGQVRITAYCPCAVCCGKWAGGPTASGVMPKAGHTIAVDAYNPILPMGTRVIINGVTYRVEDTGNLARSGTDFDIYFNTHAEALAWGRRTHTAYVADNATVTHTGERRILEVTLTSRSLTDVINSRMNAEQLEMYNVYMLTKGARQYVGSPFPFNWLPNVSSYYGYRIHPIHKDKRNHRGVDIGLPQGTEIQAAHGGTVTFAGDSGDYGLLVVIEDAATGFITKYAHCSALLVSNGQGVKAGDAIARVGSTGLSTGPHLHFEVLRNGIHLNPLYFALSNSYDP
jgi:3D (Asp-Asp-Asp) domain-containing protein